MVLAHCVDFVALDLCPVLFDIDGTLKRCVGGLVPSDRWIECLHIALLGFCCLRSSGVGGGADYGVSASLFERATFLLERCTSDR